VENANSDKSKTAPFSADGLSVAQIMVNNGFTSLKAVDLTGATVDVGAGAGAAAGAGDAAATAVASATGRRYPFLIVMQILISHRCCGSLPSSYYICHSYGGCRSCH
jgi:hypothetical protein